MRAKEQRLVVTFHTTTEAMAAEKELKLNQIAGRLIPVPRQISAGCGLAWSAPAAGEEAVRTCMERHNLAWESMGIYLI
ncbi:MAG: DUF3343 domain-containing protein [Hungatella hathewayi]|uniref:Putative Se/S carrier protein-like domain-containing protein n=1 Tax=Hungatella hathewayi WAL-18680 TaxID=742737 RepID=G5IIF5_9FIRM|nr:DUF3343 domain-containing protein [Hungatella hathewayi]EHI58737.1 hypothetical protein HMPREF9473_03283 [ [Hungatella hathewayi WAL-18680]MBS4983512.1 DUF3343 domain-containing protein [Hungatella hathewayi]